MGVGGRWNIDLRTNKKKYIFQPLEELRSMKKGSFDIVQEKIDNKIDLKYKPGFYLQTKNFLEKKFERFCTIQNQIDSFKFLSRIGNYKK